MNDLRNELFTPSCKVTFLSIFFSVSQKYFINKNHKWINTIKSPKSNVLHYLYIWILVVKEIYIINLMYRSSVRKILCTFPESGIVPKKALNSCHIRDNILRRVTESSSSSEDLYKFLLNISLTVFGPKQPHQNKAQAP